MQLSYNQSEDFEISYIGLYHKPGFEETYSKFFEHCEFWVTVGTDGLSITFQLS